MSAALGLAMTWPWAFAVTCSGDFSGVLICLLKSEEGEEIERRVKQAVDGIPKPGARSFISDVLENASSQLATAESGSVTFSRADYFDLSLDEKRLAAMVGDSAQIGTFSLSLGEATDTQALVLYAPNGSLQPVKAAAETVTPQKTRETPSGPLGQAPGLSLAEGVDPRGSGELRRIENAPRNIERLLEVELDVVVRFGVTNVPLRDVVRMGVGTMIELNRAVDEPVELLVNGRPLARGEVVVVDGYYGVRITEISPAAVRESIL
jgi:flagellar motor switch protein FliN